MICRICGSASVREVGVFPFYRDYQAAVFDCTGCGCRFAGHDPLVHERLHGSDSTYHWHTKVQHAITAFRDAGDQAGLAGYLRARDERVRFIDDALRTLPVPSRILEIGCSRGYLSALLLQRGHQVLGTDVSTTALAAARAAFGDHFCQPGDPRVQQGGAWDAIVHAGTIGCVDQPLLLTRQWLSMLRPGGLLVFNAPNREASDLLGTPWVSGTTPPDLVTLFPPDFWTGHFSDQADVSVTIRPAMPATAWVLARLAPGLLRSRSYLFRRALLRDAGLVMRRKGLYLASRAAMRWSPPPALPAEFGVFVHMRKR